MKFSEVLAEFNDRCKEVDLYFALVASSDNGELMVVRGVGPQKSIEGTPPAEWGIMLKGAAYLVLYNLIEAFVRRGFSAVYEAIRHDDVCGHDLTDLLRTQWIAQRNRKVKPFDGAPKVYMEIANELITEMIEKRRVQLSLDHMPNVGNYDADAIRHLCQIHGAESTPEPSTRGGLDITRVKEKRNNLAHGLESFIESGRAVSADDLIKAKEQIAIYLKNILDHLKAFADHKKYRKETTKSA